jgi:hypothetical protein
LSIEYDPKKDYYKILGVGQNAARGEITSSIRRLAKQYHPDVNPDETDSERFKDITAAYHVLSNDQRRREYDEARSVWGIPSTAPPGPPPRDPQPATDTWTSGSTDPGAGWERPPPPRPPRPPSGMGARTPGSTDSNADPPWPPFSFTPPIRLIALSIAAVIVLVLVILSLTVFSSPPGPAATDEAAVSKAEAATVNSVVDSSESSQIELLGAVYNVGKCTDLAGSVGQISQVLGQRASELSEASGLATGALPNSVPLRSYLVETIRMFQHSDEIFLSWAEEVSARGCTPPNLYSSAYNEAATLFQEAEVAEDNFIQLWNPVASENGFQPRSKASF